MITKIRIKNFKQFEDVEIKLNSSTVFIGPNNSGKTTALQALALWSIGLRTWIEQRKENNRKSRVGVTINRQDLVTIPVPAANLLWRNIHVRQGSDKGTKKTFNICISIIVEGITDDKEWTCGLEFDYANNESFYCRPLRIDPQGNDRMSIPPEAAKENIAFLPPMSGIAEKEYVKSDGEIAVLIGQGQTAQVLRNLCHKIFINPDKALWKNLTTEIKRFFGIELEDPILTTFSEIQLSYRLENKKSLDISCCGRGLHQTLLLLAHLYLNPKAVLLLDEPDAHLEILRQKQIYNLLSEIVKKQNSQLIIASHSEVILNEAAGNDSVIAFVGSPHSLMGNESSQILKALKTIGFEDYLLAQQNGWVLYLEDNTDLIILQQFAALLGHPITKYLDRPFVKYLKCNVPAQAREHFYGLSEAYPQLYGVLLLDRIEKTKLFSSDSFKCLCWEKREIENYFCNEDVLMKFAVSDCDKDTLFGNERAKMHQNAMRESISEVVKILNELDEENRIPWSDDIKASDQFMDLIFKRYFNKLNSPVQFRKADYWQLIRFMEPDKVDPEVIEKLDEILRIAEKANPY